MGRTTRSPHVAGGAPAVRVLQVGPAVTTQGGIASVIEELCRTSTPRLVATPYATWWPNAPVRSMLAGLALVARLPFLRRRYDVVHVHLSEGGSFVREGFVAIAARRFGFRTAATVHGADFPGFLAERPGLVRQVLGACDTVFCLGSRTRAVVDDVVPGRAATVANPVQPRPAPGAAPSTARPSVLFAGVLGERKGFDVLLAAWPAVLDRVPGAQLHVAGPRGDLAVPEGAEGIVHHGLVSRAEVDALLEGTTVACLPSRREVLPMFVLEALAAGVPVVASDAGELGDLRDCPAARILPNPLDPARLAEALVEALETEHGSLRSAAHDWVARTAFADRVLEDLHRGYMGSSDLVAASMLIGAR